MLQPYKGKVYDPAMGSGGFFVQSEKFIEKARRQDRQQISGRLRPGSNPTTWRLAAMNMAIRGIDFNFGKHPATPCTNDLHPTCAPTSSWPTRPST
jgi:type I restriction enzyme M protein